MKLSPEDLKKKATEIHNKIYDYSKTNFSSKMYDKVTIICKKHGDFEKKLGLHIKSKKGCPKCVIRSQCLPHCIKKFKEEAGIKHNNIYDYSKVIYINSATKVEIICNIHGSFWQIPNHHKTRGHGCPKCKGIKNGLRCVKTLENFNKESIIKHNGFYDYSKVLYVNSVSKIIITCPNHGDFKQTPASHLAGNGCKFCALDATGWTTKSRFAARCRENTGIFYIIRCFKNEEVFYKLGLTSRSIKERYGSIYHMPYKYEVVQEIKGTPEFLWDLEFTLKSYIKISGNHYIPEIKFGGHLSECYKL